MISKSLSFQGEASSPMDAVGQVEKGRERDQILQGAIHDMVMVFLATYSRNRDTALQASTAFQRGAVWAVIPGCFRP